MENATIPRIRQAIESGDYTRATALWNAYAGWLREELTAGRLTQPVWAETTELVTWSRNVLLCARAQAGDCLNTLHVASVYGPKAPHKAPRLRITL